MNWRGIYKRYLSKNQQDMKENFLVGTDPFKL